MSEGTSARIASVAITTGDVTEVIDVDPETEGPQSVTVTTGDGRKVTVNADGSLRLYDGRKVTIGADGAIRVKRPRKSPGVGGVSVNMQVGDGCIQTNIG